MICNFENKLFNSNLFNVYSDINVSTRELFLSATTLLLLCELPMEKNILSNLFNRLN